MEVLGFQSASMLGPTLHPKAEYIEPNYEAILRVHELILQGSSLESPKAAAVCMTVDF